ncbi:DNA-binding transcriptional regulator, MerR family [Agrococcus baldri]|uniref:DNA-binding transcriptional regulator, MerR family n=1 Tax=Agrococcus baldri TaxID=153730 RepID=A0AA94HLM3_9MICO|nr:MerR family transcriptional regulator [Agrococcus baldri]SFS08260.1 DNA-binding transcriptional regulator, MerR family [Agrococcus baldri]
MLIGEVARRSGVSSRMLRHYDRLGLVVPSARTSGGYREYARADVERLLRVEALRTLGLSLGEIGALLDDERSSPAALVPRLIAQAEARIAHERQLLARLRGIEQAGSTDWEGALQIVSLLRGLGSEQPLDRQRAALDAGTGGTLGGIALAEAVLGEQEQNVAGTLRWALAAGDAAAALPPLAAALASAELEVRRRAVDALADLRGPGADATLRVALEDADPVVRGRAALALAGRGDHAAEPVLVAMVVEGERDVDAAEALASLAEATGPEPSIRHLVARLEGAGPEVRRRIAQALIELPGPVATAALRRLAGDDEPGVAMTARAALRLLG